MIDDSALTEALFGRRKKKRTRQTTWNEESMFAGELQKELEEQRELEKQLNTQKPIPIDEDDNTMIDTKKIRLARKLTYGKEKTIPVSQYMQKLREQYVLINHQPKWATLDEDFTRPIPPDIRSSSPFSM